MNPTIVTDLVRSKNNIRYNDGRWDACLQASCRPRGRLPHLKGLRWLVLIFSPPPLPRLRVCMYHIAYLLLSNLPISTSIHSPFGSVFERPRYAIVTRPSVCICCHSRVGFTRERHTGRLKSPSSNPNAKVEMAPFSTQFTSSHTTEWTISRINPTNVTYNAS